MLDRLHEACSTAFSRPPLLVSNDPRATDWAGGLACVPDVQPGCGPLGGLLTAVECGPAPVVVVAWDMPFVTAALLRRLADGLAHADACLPASPGPRGLEPLCAAYGPACGPAIRAVLANGERRLVGFHDAVRVDIVPATEIAPFGDPARLFLNVNTPADLLLAQRLCDAAPETP